jgi:hypothetical protein
VKELESYISKIYSSRKGNRSYSRSLKFSIKEEGKFLKC